MIRSSPTLKVAALSTAALMHGVAVWALMSDTPVEIEGAPGSAEASIGSSFADMAMGTLTAEQTTDPAEPLETETVAEPLQPADAVLPDQPELTPDATPDRAESTKPLQAEPVVPERVAAALPPVPDAAIAASPGSVAEPLQPVDAVVPDQPALIPDATPDRAESIKPLQAEPVVPERVATALPPVPDAVIASTPETGALAATPAEVADSTEENVTAVARSLRPQSRSKAFEDRHKTSPRPVKRTAQEPKKRKTVASARGNADQNAVAGSPTGSKRARSQANSSDAGNAQATGNAAASNYPGKVMRKISRVPKPRVGQKGAAVVAFTIASNGQLSGLSLASSSGSRALDQAALRVIRRAAPFPPPPPGAMRNFSIKIKGS